VLWLIYKIQGRSKIYSMGATPLGWSPKFILEALRPSDAPKRKTFPYPKRVFYPI